MEFQCIFSFILHRQFLFRVKVVIEYCFELTIRIYYKIKRGKTKIYYLTNEEIEAMLLESDSEQDNDLKVYFCRE